MKPRTQYRTTAKILPVRSLLFSIVGYPVVDSHKPHHAGHILHHARTGCNRLYGLMHPCAFHLYGAVQPCFTFGWIIAATEHIEKPHLLGLSLSASMLAFIATTSA